MKREARIERKTKETDIRVHLVLEDDEESRVTTGIPFMDHMLTLFSAHAGVGLELLARGDLEVDDHHTVEDLGIVMGLALKTALGDKAGICRYGEATLPMDETLVRVVLDLSNRPGLFFRVPFQRTHVRTFDVMLLREFFQGFVNHAGMTLHIDLFYGEEPHHIAECIFKAFARAVSVAVSLDPGRLGRIPSTKGIL